jgi:hypothetical protein
MSVAICGLMALATVSFALASLVHLGLTLRLGFLTLDDPFAGAAIPEAVIAVVLGISTAMIVLGQAKRWSTAFGATVFAILLTAYGLSVTLASSRTGDITYHIFVLALLLVIMVLPLLPAGRRSLTRPKACRTFELPRTNRSSCRTDPGRPTCGAAAPPSTMHR